MTTKSSQKIDDIFRLFSHSILEVSRDLEREDYEIVICRLHTILDNVKTRFNEKYPKPEKVIPKRHETITWKNQRKVICVETGEVYKSIRDAARNMNTVTSNLWACINNPRKTCKGYHWKYEN